MTSNKGMRKSFTLCAAVILVLAVFLLTPLRADAAETNTTYGTLTFSFDGEGTMTITGTGGVDYGNYYVQDAIRGCCPNFQFDVETLILGEGITAIGYKNDPNCDNGFFNGCMEVQFPSTLKEIWPNAFCGSHLCGDMIIPEGVESIGPRAFLSLSGNLSYKKDYLGNSHYIANCMQSVSFPSTLKSIGNYAFDSCWWLNSITFNENCPLAEIPTGCFAGCGMTTGFVDVVLPSKLKTIGKNAFAEVRTLRSVNIPASVELIKEKAFYNCQYLSPAYDGGLFFEGSAPQAEANAFQYTESCAYYGCGYESSFAELKNRFSNLEWYLKHSGTLSKVSVTAPTYEADGYTTYKCSACGNTYKSDYVAKLQPIQMYNTSVKLSYTTTYYTGSAKKPSVTVTYDGKQISSDNYTLTYSDNINVGYASVTITGKNALTGSNTYYFTIFPKKPSITSYTNTADGIKIKWNKVSSASCYRIDRIENGITTTLYTTFDNSEVSFTDSETKSVKTGKKYQYKVVSIYRTYYGNALETESAAKTAYRVKAPSKLTLTAGSKSAKVAIKKVSGATGYEIYRSTKKSSGYSKVKTTTSLTWKNKSMKKGKTYYYKVKTYRTVSGKKIYSNYSKVYSVKTR